MPERLDLLFQTSHRLSEEAIRSLTATDLDQLRSIASGGEPSPYRARAMDLLVMAATPDLPQLLAEILGNADEDPAVRAAAATQLARTGRPQVEDLLLRSLPTATDLVVRVKIVAALARVGSPFSLVELDRLTGDPEPTVSRLAAFSRSVIAYRAGLSGHELPVPAPQDFLEVDVESSAPLVVGPAGVQETRATLADLRNDTFGLDLSSEAGLRIECGLSRLFLTLSEEFVRRGLAGLLRQPMLPGLIAQRAPSDGSYSVRMLLLAGPQEDGGFHIAVHRTDGSQMLFGSGAEDEEGATFELRSVRGKGSLPALLRGRVQGFKIVFTEAAAAQRVGGQSTPQPLIP
jgi:HEAT repeat protein